MKKWLFMAMLFLQKLSFSQDPCLPTYQLPAKQQPISNGIQVGYVEAGQGKTVLLLHGLGGNLSHWLPVMKAMATSYHVIALDFPGYGASDKVLPDTTKDAIQFYADAVSQFIQQKGLMNVVLAGHSMGGQVAMVTALQSPELVSHLVLVAPAGLETFSQQEGALLIGASQPAVFEKQEEAAIRASFKMNFYELPGESEVLVQDRLRLKSCPDFKIYTQVVSAGVKGMLAHPVKSELKNIKQPTLILFGENDALIPNPYLHPHLTKEALVKEATALLPQSKVVMVGKAGHLLPFEKPTLVSQAINEFLK